MAQFLKELRCENTGRDGYLNLPEYKASLAQKVKCCQEYELAMRSVPEKARTDIQNYVVSVEKCAEEENQQAYIQGIADTMMVLSGIGLLSPEERVKKIIEQLK